VSDESPTPARRPLIWWVAAAALVLVLLVALFIWQPWRPATPEPTESPSATASFSQTPVPSASIPPATASGTPTVVPSATLEPTVTSSIGATAQTGGGVTARVDRITAVQGEARGPGEVAGPALRVTLEVANGSSKPIDLSTVVVNLYYGKNSKPATALSGPDLQPFSGDLAAGARATGSYVFNVPTSQRDLVRVEFRYSTEAATAIFEGAA
jgi:hypothetical protein